LVYILCSKTHRPTQPCIETVGFLLTDKTAGT
jgi:hypothetical protein